MTLDCKCGATASFANSVIAVNHNWMLGDDNKPMCPTCTAKYEAKAKKQRVSRYGEAATARGEAIYREKHGK